MPNTFFVISCQQIFIVTDARRDPLINVFLEIVIRFHSSVDFRKVVHLEKDFLLVVDSDSEAPP